jgi:hypothetical protein
MFEMSSSLLMSGNEMLHQHIIYLMALTDIDKSNETEGAINQITF